MITPSMHMFRPSQASLTERESRLMYFAGIEVPQSEAAERFDPKNAAEKNPELKDMLAIYEDPLVVRRNPVLKNPLDHAYFRALVLHNSIVVDQENYKKATRDQVNPVLPKGLIPDGTAPGNDTGVVLQKFMSEERRKQLDPNDGQLVVGTEFAKRVDAAKVQWDSHQKIEDPLVVDTVVDYYVHCRATLDAALQENRIIIPDGQKIAAGIDNGLQRDEYFALLTMTWDGELDDVQKAAEEGIGALRRLIGVSNTSLGRAKDVYTDQSFRTLGPSETLDRFGVNLGPQLQKQYVDARNGKDPIPSAQMWMVSPEHAVVFFEQRLPNTTGNAQFISAVRALAEKNDALLPDGMKHDDARVMLSLVAQVCLQHEQSAKVGQEQLDKLMLGRGIKLDHTIEKTGADVWKFMLDIREHPIASGIIWLGAIAAARVAWETLTRPASRWSRWLFMGAMGGVGYGLYQQHKSGKAWWDDMLKNTKDFMGKDQQKPAEEQTLVNHWTEKLKLDDRWFSDNLPLSNKHHADACLATLQQQPVKLVFDWYDDMRTKKTDTIPTEFRGKYSKMFGDMSSKDRAKLFYGVLKELFKDRGEYVLKHHIDSMYPSMGGVSDTEQLGYDYMRDKYDRKIMYEVVATQLQEKFRVELETDPPVAITAEGLNLRDTDILNRPDIAALKETKPGAYAMLETYLANFQPVYNDRDSSNWTMADIFMAEADPEILRRMGQDGARPASWLEEMQAAAGFTPTP